MTTPKLPPPPRSAQNRSGSRFGVDRTERAVGGDDVGGEQVVDGQAVLAHQPAEPAAEGQAGDAGVRHGAAGRGQAERLRLAVELAPQHAALARRRAAVGSTRMPFIGARSMTRPPSLVP